MFTVLYVDDEKHNLTAFKSNFRRFYNIETAISGAEALALVRNQPIDMVITDQRMPEMTGVELLKIIKREFPDAVRIILTAYSDVDAIVEAINHIGIYQYVRKPWDVEELRMIIDNALEGYRLKQENRELFTNLQNANQQLEQYNYQLEQKVAERTQLVELQKAEIKSQRDLLAEANATKDKFFSIISHDMKNHFTGLLSISQTLALYFDKIENAEKQEYIKRIHNSARNLYNFLHNLLEWATSQTGQITCSRTVFDIITAINDEALLIADNALKKNITLVVPQSQNHVMVYADNNMIATVLRNLVSNAVKFSPNGSTITIGLEQYDKHIQVSVTDQGVGIAPESIDKLFRIDVKTKTVAPSGEQGTGLGLILSKEFVERNNGTIGVKSQEGKGSTFYFTLPLAT